MANRNNNNVMSNKIYIQIFTVSKRKKKIGMCRSIETSGTQDVKDLNH
jgi:hypothetical protein